MLVTTRFILSATIGSGFSLEDTEEEEWRGADVGGGRLER